MYTVLGCLIVGILAAYLTAAYFMAKDKVSSAPREDMYICDVHGPIAKRHVLKLEGILADEPIETCPICFHEKMKGKK